jgi:3-isopropylmalate/(R)-2-methylmalate dehydratase small subunit
MIFHGRVWKFGNNIDTDVIIPVQYTTGTDANEFANHCMEGIEPGFSGKIKKGDIIVAGTNFGCGSSREPAPIAIKAAGISCIIAKSYARIFYRNAFNVGLPLLVSSEAADGTKDSDELEVNLNTGTIKDISRQKTYKANAIPSFMQELIRDGGLINHIIKKNS